MSTIAPITNVQKFDEAMKSLDSSANQMLLVFGPPGMGKTTCAANRFARHNGILLRCITGLSQKALLRMLLRELGAEPKFSTNGENLLQLLELVSRSPRPIFVDEADRLFERKALFESLRDIHDQCRIPIIMLGASSSVGFKGVDHHLRLYPQMADRICNWLQFAAATKEDLTTLQHHYIPGIELSDGLRDRLMRDSQGNIRRIREGLRKCEFLAKSKKLKALDESMFGKSNLISLKAVGE